MPSPPPYYVEARHHSVFVNGSIYWFEVLNGYKILSLDLHTEQFHDVSQDRARITYTWPLVNLEDLLAMVSGSAELSDWKLAIWTLIHKKRHGPKLTQCVYSLDIFAPTM
ncbi:unnamed protein product [Arabidopsis thaliana]|uniref:F-box associated domain-containing protein n=1 Tax=Arabidopsis thaliana TaxID=3702 RepID=A0A654EXD7_ARATH|nr:unnamed protein product [Arabidopsis thaliana]